MSIINNVLKAVLDLASSAPGVYVQQIGIGALPPDNGICAQISTGTGSPFLDLGAAYQFSMVLNGKHRNQQTVSDALNNIHQTLTQTAQLPSGDGYQITAIETTQTPSYLGREQNAQHLYGSSLRVKFYFKKG